MRILRATNRNIEYFCAPKHIFTILYEDLYIKNVARLSCEMAQNAPGAQNAPNTHVWDSARIPEEQEKEQKEEQYSSIRTIDNLPSYLVAAHNYKLLHIFTITMVTALQTRYYLFHVQCIIPVPDLSVSVSPTTPTLQFPSPISPTERGKGRPFSD